MAGGGIVGERHVVLVRLPDRHPVGLERESPVTRGRHHLDLRAHERKLKTRWDEAVRALSILQWDEASCPRPRANPALLLRRPDDPSRGGADLLRADVALPDAPAGRLAARASASTPRPTTRSSATCATSRRRRCSTRSTARCAERSRARGRRPRRWRSASWWRSTGRPVRWRPPPRAQRGVRGGGRPQLPPPEGDRHRVHLRAHGTGAREPRDGVRGRALRRRPARASSASGPRSPTSGTSPAGPGRCWWRCSCSPTSTT